MAKPELIERVRLADLPEGEKLPEADGLPAPVLGQTLYPQGTGTGTPKMALGLVADGADSVILKHFPDGSVKGTVYSYAGKTLKKFDRGATMKTVPIEPAPPPPPVTAKTGADVASSTFPPFKNTSKGQPANP
jgi:hypothetical protein